LADDFKETEVGERYAQALFDLSLEEGSLEAVRADLWSLKAMIADSRDLKTLLASPGFSAEDKLNGLTAIGKAAGFHPTTMKFLGVLTTNRRASQLPAVIASFARLYDKHRGVVAAEVVTAVKLSAKQLEGVAAQLRASLGKDPEITTTVDPSILGGLKVRVGSRLFDASLKSRLDQMKFALKRA
jgi:F-type H+-transporting ATPase subunit delta